MGKQAAARRARQAERQREQSERDRLPPWTPFQRAYAVADPFQRERMVQDMMRITLAHGSEITRQLAEDRVDEALSQELWRNSRYTVAVDRNPQPRAEGWPPMIHLSIKRNDREVPKEERWRDFQRLKDELVGREYEAVELYPAEERIVDTSNQFHLWVVSVPGFQFPFGFRPGRAIRDDGADGTTKARQRPFEG